MNCQVLLEKSICLLSMNVTELKKLNRQPIIALGEFVLLSMVGCIVDGPTAAGGNWKSLINVGLIMGVIAGACGNYAGIFVAYAVKAICGL